MYSCTRAMPCISRQGIISGSMARGSGWSSRMTNHISEGSPRRPVRPMRCKKPDTVKGASSWKARSSLPISMPSSKVAVAQTDSSEPSSFISSSALSR